MPFQCNEVDRGLREHLLAESELDETASRDESHHALLARNVESPAAQRALVLALAALSRASSSAGGADAARRAYYTAIFWLLRFEALLEAAGASDAGVEDWVAHQWRHPPIDGGDVDWNIVAIIVERARTLP